MDDALRHWVSLFPETTVEVTDETLFQGKFVFALNQFLSDQPVDVSSFSEEKKGWFDRYKQVKPLCEALSKQYPAFKADPAKLIRHSDTQQLQNLLTMLFLFSKTCPKKDIALERFSTLSPEDQSLLNSINSAPEPASEPDPAPSHDAAIVSRTASHIIEPPHIDLAAGSARIRNEGLQQEIDDANKEIARLTEENKTLQENIEKARSASQDDQKDWAEYGRLKATLLTQQVSNQRKKQLKQQLEDSAKLVTQMQTEFAQLQTKLAELEKDSATEAGPDYTILYDKLQQIRLDPMNQEVEKQREQIEKYRKVAMKINKRNTELQTKLKGQQGVAVLEERLKFSQKVHEANEGRLKRADMTLLLNQKKMRIDAFQLEMRNFL